MTTRMTRSLTSSENWAKRASSLSRLTERDSDERPRSRPAKSRTSSARRADRRRATTATPRVAGRGDRVADGSPPRPAPPANCRGGGGGERIGTPPRSDGESAGTFACDHCRDRYNLTAANLWRGPSWLTLQVLGSSIKARPRSMLLQDSSEL